jgi:hypothetical protein
MGREENLTTKAPRHQESLSTGRSGRSGRKEAGRRGDLNPKLLNPQPLYSQGGRGDQGGRKQAAGGTSTEFSSQNRSATGQCRGGALSPPGPHSRAALAEGTRRGSSTEEDVIPALVFRRVSRRESSIWKIPSFSPLRETEGMTLMDRSRKAQGPPRKASNGPGRGSNALGEDPNAHPRGLKTHPQGSKSHPQDSKVQRKAG